MNKQLLHKYLKGTSSPEETKWVEEWILQSKENTSYFNQIKTEFIINTFENTSKEVSVNKSYQVFKSKHIKPKSVKSRHYVSVLKYAAVFLILLTSSYFIYINQSRTKEFIIPDNVVTLELQDGTKKIIDEEGTLIILGKNKKVLGKQEGKQLIYKKGDLKRSWHIIHLMCLMEKLLN
ncbi:hypothetical protein JL193_07940 [Polaribacter batillariae]|uniref:Anti-sigma factor n=1 Tax=Polaribacter batillariae TaxID=2808900 RepID=A0ABX7T079_9FLAO|nr:hypothetical protein [Polaribacter batillariae]QTD39156.1 hypothetical protein JL193_07940 [Polaribacter batillariae]